MTGKTVAIVGGGPAGLTAALELVRRTRMRVIVLEASGDLGGISKTVNHKGNRIDIGGHRFFSKSDWVMNWWQDILPIDHAGPAVDISYQNKSRPVEAGRRDTDPDRVMLVRNRLSRIYFDGKFFPYPIKADVGTAMKLGPLRVSRMMASYARARAFPRQPEVSLEDFLLNRFGYELYDTFFKHYTEKVWGVPCSEISAEWGAQRIKGLNISKAIAHALKAPFKKLRPGAGGAANTSLIERFLYPKYGPGQMWETVAEQVQAGGGEIRFHEKAVGLQILDGKVRALTTQNVETGERTTIQADHVISTMPVTELVAAMGPGAPEAVHRVAAGLEYRDFITVGLLLRKMAQSRGAQTGSPINLVPDNWIYIQDKGIEVGRLQFFNNWSPYMVADPATAWVGMEYFCREGDGLWSQSDAEMTDLGIREMEVLGLAHRADLLDSLVLRVPKAYPGYYGSYGQFDTIRQFTDSVPNLFLVGRNGMHRYNNQDHSMLTARCAVDAIIADSPDKSALWAVNIDDDYHEEKSTSTADAKEAAGHVRRLPLPQPQDRQTGEGPYATPSADGRPALAIVVPVRNEAGNIAPLIEETVAALHQITPPLPGGYEIVYVDDGSDDATPQQLADVATELPELVVRTHAKSCGQSAAIRTGVLAARAHWIATLDGDGQNDPADLPKMIAALTDDGISLGRQPAAAWGSPSAPLGLVAGQRLNRRDTPLRRLSSSVANGVRSRLLGDGAPDTGCGLKLFPRSAFLELAYFDHMHRFLPALMRREGYRVILVPVSHRPRLSGRSKYGIHNRLWVGIVDLFGVIWLNRRHRRPEIAELSALGDEPCSVGQDTETPQPARAGTPSCGTAGAARQTSTTTPHLTVVGRTDTA